MEPGALLARREGFAAEVDGGSLVRDFANALTERHAQRSLPTWILHHQMVAGPPADAFLGAAIELQRFPLVRPLIDNDPHGHGNLPIDDFRLMIDDWKAGF